MLISSLFGKAFSLSHQSPFLLLFMMSKCKVSAGHISADVSEHQSEHGGWLLACPSRSSMIWPQLPAQHNSPLCSLPSLFCSHWAPWYWKPVPIFHCLVGVCFSPTSSSELRDTVQSLKDTNSCFRWTLWLCSRAKCDRAGQRWGDPGEEQAVSVLYTALWGKSLD